MPARLTPGARFERVAATATGPARHAQRRRPRRAGAAKRAPGSGRRAGYGGGARAARPTSLLTRAGSCGACSSPRPTRRSATRWASYANGHRPAPAKPDGSASLTKAMRARKPNTRPPCTTLSCEWVKSRGAKPVLCRCPAAGSLNGASPGAVDFDAGPATASGSVAPCSNGTSRSLPVSCSPGTLIVHNRLQAHEPALVSHLNRTNALLTNCYFTQCSARLKPREILPNDFA